jgi:hypothetical protein
MLTRLQELEELAAKLLATARKLPPGPSRHNALQLIGRFRVQLICNAPICQYIRGRRRREHGGPSPATEAEYRAFFAAAIEAHADAIIVGDTAENFSKAQLIAELASARRLPAAYTNGEYVNVGGLLSYGYDISNSYRRAAGYVSDILKGAKPVGPSVLSANRVASDFERRLRRRLASASLPRFSSAPTR